MQQSITNFCILISDEGWVMKPAFMAEFDERASIAQLPDGTLMAFYIRKVDGGHEVAVQLSVDNGYSWGPPKTLFTLAEGRWAGCNVLVDREGEVHFFFLKWRDETNKYLDIWHSKSTHGRKSWQVPKCIWKGYCGSLNSAIQLRNGRIICPMHTHIETRTWGNRPAEGFDAYMYTGKASCTALYSDDSGDTWHRSPADLKVPVPNLSAYGGVEPVVLELKDGRIWMLIRTQMGRLYESFSKDGVAWSDPKPTRFISSDSPAALIRLKDGRIVLLWNCCLRFPYAYGGRHVLHAAISEDEGCTWRGYREVLRDPYRNQPPPQRGDHGTAYPFPALTKDGKVICFTGQGQGRFGFVLLDPEWLYETTQKDDFSDGLEEWSIFGTKGVDLAPHPEKKGAKVLKIRKTHAEWPAAAVWNFPLGIRGRIRMKLSLKPGFKGAMLLITDHFSVPYDQEDEFYTLYKLRMNSDGQLPSERLVVDRWCTLQFEWDCAKRICRVSLDDRQVVVLPQLRMSEGACYLRLHSTAEQTDNAGFLVEFVEADVSQSWKPHGA